MIGQVYIVIGVLVAVTGGLIKPAVGDAVAFLQILAGGFFVALGVRKEVQRGLSMKRNTPD